MSKATFEWDSDKNKINQLKHGVSFTVAQYAFFDPFRVIAEDVKHGTGEKRYFCFGKIGQDIITVRFTYRESKIRIIGAGYWRKGKVAYEERNKIY